MMQQRNQVIGQYSDLQLGDIAEWGRLSMTSEIEANQSYAGRRAVHTPRLALIAAQAVLEYERQTEALIPVPEAKTVAM
jgi:hypothetical protein